MASSSRFLSLGVVHFVMPTLSASISPFSLFSHAWADSLSGNVLVTVCPRYVYFARKLFLRSLRSMTLPKVFLLMTTYGGVRGTQNGYLYGYLNR